MKNLFNELGGHLEAQKAIASVGGVQYGFEFVPWLSGFFANKNDEDKGIGQFFFLGCILNETDKVIELELWKPKSGGGFDKVKVKHGRMSKDDDGNEKENRLSKMLTKGTDKTPAPAINEPFIFLYSGIKPHPEKKNRSYHDMRIYLTTGEPNNDDPAF